VKARVKDMPKIWAEKAGLSQVYTVSVGGCWWTSYHTAHVGGIIEVVEYTGKAHYFQDTDNTPWRPVSWHPDWLEILPEEPEHKGC